ncbi:MAG: hypothetical protein KTR31_08295 [Myxococcales bacterium]|nr:hypothetical protein [Myxococcales bacterium]
MALPDRTREAEDRFVEQFLTDDDMEFLVEAIEHAMEARRPRLAARLVGLLGERVPVEAGSDLDRAKRAAHLMLFDKTRPEDLSWSELEDAWGRVRRRRLKRIKARMRASIAGSSARFGRLGTRRRG